MHEIRLSHRLIYLQIANLNIQKKVLILYLFPAFYIVDYTQFSTVIGNRLPAVAYARYAHRGSLTHMLSENFQQHFLLFVQINQKLYTDMHQYLNVVE